MFLPGKVNFPAIILAIVSLSDLPWNGGIPYKKINIITPQLQTSHFEL